MIAVDDHLYFMHQGVLHSTPAAHPNPIRFMRVPTGALVESFVWGNGKVRQAGREGGPARCWGPRLGPLGVWCLALLLCRDLVMRCDAMRCELVPARNAGSQAFPS